MIQIIVMALFTLTMGEDKEELNNMKEMMMEMNQRVLLTEETLKKTQEELKYTRSDLAKAFADLSIAKDELKEAIYALANTKNCCTESLDQIATKNDLDSAKEELIGAITNLATKDDHLMTKAEELQRDIAILKDSPFFHACGSYNNGLYIRTQTIPYSSLFYNSTNTEGGGLDLETGIFSSPYPGSYSVTWSILAGDGTGERAVSIFLHRNGEIVEESQHLSSYTGADGYVYDQGRITNTIIIVYDQGRITNTIIIAPVVVFKSG